MILNKNIIFTIAAIVISLLLFSCSWQLVSFVPTGDTFPPLEDYRQVKVFYTTKPDTSAYHEIGILEVEVDNFEDRYEYARQKAASVGGDAIIPLSEQYYTESKLEIVQTQQIVIADSLGSKSFIRRDPVIVDKQHVSQRFIVVRMKK